MDRDNITDIYTYLRAHAAELGARILETYPPLQSTKDPITPAVGTLLRKALPAQGLAITGTARYLRQAKAARIVAECGAGKTLRGLQRQAGSFPYLRWRDEGCDEVGGRCNVPPPLAARLRTRRLQRSAGVRTPPHHSLG